MNTFKGMLNRNIKIFFKDKGMFFTALITPLILLFLFITFLGSVYRDSIVSNIPEGITAPESLINGCIGGWLFSSLLAVCCVTIAFCSNLLMVQDKANGTICDITIAPVSKTTLALSYYTASAFTTLIICFVAFAAGLIYLGIVGWYLTVTDVLLTLFDIIIMVMFGTALSSIVNFFLSTQGQISAVGTIMSAGYGFLCGAYMPISQFSDGIQKVITCLPGTYGTMIFRNHLMGSAMGDLESKYLIGGEPGEFRKAFDMELAFFDHNIDVATAYIVLGVSVAVLVIAYIILNKCKNKKH